MTALTPGQRTQLETDLQARLRSLDGRLAEHHGGLTRTEHAREVLLQDGDDAPQRDGEREVDMALSDLETQQLGAVSQALARLQEGRYGACADCGKAIPFKRLQIEPWAERCVVCEAKQEAAAGRHAPAAHHPATHPRKTPT